MKKVFRYTLFTVLAIVVFDIIILTFSLGQLAFEGRTGEWNPFWKWQAQQIVKLLD